MEVAPIYCRKTAAGAQCAIRKDGGDDVDVTTGLPVIADITLLPDAPGQVTIDGGPGVGRVTKPWTSRWGRRPSTMCRAG